MSLLQRLNLAIVILTAAGSCSAAYAGVVEANLNGGFETAGPNAGVSLFITYVPSPGFAPSSGSIDGKIEFGDGQSTNFSSIFNPNTSFNQLFTHDYANPINPPAVLFPSVSGTVHVADANSSQTDNVGYSATGFVLLFDAAPTPGPIASGVPESSTWAMMLMGFGGLGFLAHRRARNSKSSAAPLAT